MKILFQKEGKNVSLIDKERLIFHIDDYFVNDRGEEVPAEDSFYDDYYDDDTDKWYQWWMDDEGLEEPLKSESTVEPEYEIDDIWGNFGFKNEAGEFVIEPQYAFAYEFTNGLAAVNLNRTWYKTKEGKRYYENHYGYIDAKGKTVIPFQYDEAYPFNKYGVAVVSDLNAGWKLIDKNGSDIPGAKFPYISHYYDYDDRFLEFSYDYNYDDDMFGLYDTKERKILLEPSIDSIIEYEEDCILVYMRNGKYGQSDFRQHYINSKGEILYPWLYNKDFAIVKVPDENKVTAVAKSQYIELEGEPNSYFPHNGKKYDRKFIYGLYSSKGEYLMPMEYEEIRNMTDNIWACVKNGIVTVVKTEEGD